MEEDRLKPIDLTSLGAHAVALFLIGLCALLAVSIPSLRMNTVGKVTAAMLATSGAAATISWLMFWRNWRHVKWEIGFRAFVTEPAPPYEEARRAWLWGRRLRVLAVVYLASLVATAAMPLLAVLWLSD